MKTVAADAVAYADPEDKKQIGIEIHSGQNRVIRRLFESMGYRVKKLDRVYYAGLTKKNLSREEMEISYPERTCNAEKRYILMDMNHRSGFVNILGNPNTGKSTIMNALVGEKLSIITSKAQTTRHRIMGIVNSDDFQIVYSDTPGILKPAYKLQESMMSFVNSAISDADIILYVTDVTEKPLSDKVYPEKIKSLGYPGHCSCQQDRPVKPGGP